MNQQPNAVKNALVEIRTTLMSPEMKHRLASVLGNRIDPDKFAQVAMIAISKNPDLVNADRSSLFTSCMECAADGLLPNGKDAALVVFNTKLKEGGKEVWKHLVQYLPMVRGIYKVAQRVGAARLFNARVVYEKDEFHYEYGFEPMLKHVPATGTAGPMVAVYAAVVKPDGTRDLEVMSKADVEAVRARAKSPDSPAWKYHFDEMAKKTVVHRISKRLDLTPELQQVIDRIEADYDYIDGDAAEEPASVTGAAPRAEDFAQPEAEPSDYELYDEVGACVSTHTSREWAEELTRSIAGFGKANAPDQIERVWAANQGTLERLRTEGLDEYAADVTSYCERWKAALSPKAPVTEPPEPQDERKAPPAETPQGPDAHPETSQTTEGDGEPAWVSTFRERLSQVKTEKALDSLTKATFKAPLDALAKSDRPKWDLLMGLVDGHRDHLRQQAPR